MTRETIEKLTKINKSRRILMKMLSDLKKQIRENPSDELYRRRKNYRKRLTKETAKKNSILKSTEM